MTVTVLELGKLAKAAKSAMSIKSTQAKNDILLKIAENLEKNVDYLISENEKDLDQAAVNGVAPTMLDRLKIDKHRIYGIAEGVRNVALLPDPIGSVMSANKRPNGLLVAKKRVPIGVIGIIFEARPNVTVDGAVLTIKSGNCCILRGGKEAINTNKALISIINSTEGLEPGAVNLIEDISRNSATELMQLSGYIDLLIPRGGKNLIQSVVKNATVPVIETGAGNCHTYVDEFADLEMAVNIVENAKMSRPSVCNALETLLVHVNVANEFLPRLIAKMPTVKVLGCPQTVEILGCELATDEDFNTEFNDYIMSVKVVDNIQEAVKHIEKYSTGHSECIVTENYKNACYFTDVVDSAAVYVNASTRFTDGFVFGFGAEIGISTQKIHARGPMGLEELTTTKYVILGDGQIRE